MNIVSTIPAQGSTFINLDAQLKVLFDTPVDVSSIDNSSITLATKKTNLFAVSANKIPFSGNELEGNDFYNAEFTGIVNGTVTIDPDNASQLLFTPGFRLNINTEYTAYVSQAIGGTDTTLLGVTKSFSFTTVQDDIILPVAAPVQSSVIMGTVLSQNSTIAKAGLVIESVTPKENAIMRSSNVIRIVFSKEVTLTKADIEIAHGHVFSDTEVEIVADADITIASSNSKIATITIASGVLINNEQVSVTLKSTIVSGTYSLTEYTFSYLTVFDPYLTTTRLVRLKAGTLITAVQDSSIASLIYYSSANALLLFKRVTAANNASVLRSEYVLYDVLEQILLNNQNSNTVDFIKKQLSEFSLSVSNGLKVKLYNDLLREVKAYKKALTSFLAFANNTAISKGSTRLLPTEIGRKWCSGFQPGLNTKNKNGYLAFDESTISNNVGYGVPFNPIYES